MKIKMIAARKSLLAVARQIAVREFTKRKRLRLSIFVAAFALTGSAGTIFSLTDSFADSYNTSVNFSLTTATLATAPFSSTISTYGQNNTTIAQDSAQLTTLGNLHAGYYRIPLQWNGGSIVSSAGGGPRDIPGDSWISAVRQAGGTPEIVLGGSADDNFTPSDAANMVAHFNANASAGVAANPVSVWVIGNEPDVQGMSIQQYCSLFNATVTAMKRVDPNIQVAGPAWSSFDPIVLADFLQCAGNNLDILDFHDYGMGGNWVDTSTALGDTSSYQDDVNQAYQLIRQYTPNRGIQVQVGEYNFSWTTGDGYNGWQGEDRFYQAVNTVWGASVAGHIAAAGGRGDEYADLNGALGLTFEKTDAAQHYAQSLNAPMPIYYGLEMFTGGNLFRGFGSSMVSAQTSLSNVEIFAADNGNIVMINKDPVASQTADLGLTGFSGGTADVWQTNQNAPFSPPAHLATIGVSNSLSYTLPPYSVTTFVLNGGTTSVPSTGPTAGTPTPTVSSAPTTAPPPPAPAPAPGGPTCSALNAQPGASGQYTFTVTANPKPGMTVTSYVFNFGDGAAYTTSGAWQNSVSHSYPPGKYEVWVGVNVDWYGMNTTVTGAGCQTVVNIP
jgi:hypothetical protein